MLSRPRLAARPLLSCSVAGATVCLFTSAAFAQTPGAVAEAMLTAQRAATPSFGALSLLILLGTLLAGVVSGVGLASLRPRQLAHDGGAQHNAAAPTFSRAVPTPAAPASTPPTPKREPLPPVVAEIDGGGENDAAFWIEELAHGPKFGPRIIGMVVASDCDGDDALARLAMTARDTDRDLAIIDACRGADRLATALDARLDRPMRSGSHTGARTEIVPLPDLMGGRGRPDARLLRDAFAALAARVDVVLVDLPAIADWRKIPTLISTLDDVAVLCTPDTSREELRSLCEAARVAGAPITGQVLVLDEAA